MNNDVKSVSTKQNENTEMLLRAIYNNENLDFTFNINTNNSKIVLFQTNGQLANAHVVTKKTETEKLTLLGVIVGTEDGVIEGIDDIFLEEEIDIYVMNLN